MENAIPFKLYSYVSTWPELRYVIQRPFGELVQLREHGKDEVIAELPPGAELAPWDAPGLPNWVREAQQRFMRP